METATPPLSGLRHAWQLDCPVEPDNGVYGGVANTNATPRLDGGIQSNLGTSCEWPLGPAVKPRGGNE